MWVTLDLQAVLMTKIEISVKTLLTITALILFYEFITRITYVLVIIILAYIIMAAIEPVVQILEKRHIKRSLAIFIVYAAFIIIVIGVISLIFLPLLKQVVDLAKQLPSLTTTFINSNTAIHSFIKANNINIGSLSLDTTKNLLSASTAFSTLYATAVGTGRFIAAAVLVFVMSIYMLLDKEMNTRGIIKLLPAHMREKTSD